MSYKTQNQRVMNFIDKYIIPHIQKSDVDYYKTLKVICRETKVSKKTAEEILNTYIETEQIKEVRLLTILDEQVADFFKRQNNQEKEQEKEEKKIERIFSELTNQNEKSS